MLIIKYLIFFFLVGCSTLSLHAAEDQLIEARNSSLASTPMYPPLTKEETDSLTATSEEIFRISMEAQSYDLRRLHPSRAIYDSKKLNNNIPFCFSIQRYDGKIFFLHLTYHNTSLPPESPIWGILKNSSRIFSECGGEWRLENWSKEQKDFLSKVQKQCPSTKDGMDNQIRKHSGVAMDIQIRKHSNSQKKNGFLSSQNEIQEIITLVLANNKFVPTTTHSKRSTINTRNIYLEGEFEKFCTAGTTFFDQNIHFEMFAAALNLAWMKKMLRAPVMKNTPPATYCIGAGHFSILNMLRANGCKIKTVNID